MAWQRSFPRGPADQCLLRFRHSPPWSQNITFRRAVAVNAQDGFVGAYLHNNGSYGALVSLAPAGTAPLPAAVSAVADLVAQHVVAMDPPTVAELSDQPYLFDSGKKVADVIKAESSALGAPAVLTGFVRWGGGKEVIGLKQA
jgi:translation elongation factor EF-Ts